MDVADGDGELLGAATPAPATCMCCGDATRHALFCGRCGVCAARDLPPGYVLREVAGGWTVRRPDRSGVGTAARAARGPRVWANRRTAIWAARMDLGARRREALCNTDQPPAPPKLHKNAAPSGRVRDRRRAASSQPRRSDPR